MTPLVIEMGDVALQLVGQRFQRSIREGDTLARIGGDEFAVLLPRLADQQAAALVAQRIIGALAAPLDFGTHSVGIGTSVGIAAWPEHAESADALLAAADTAMYRAKRAGRNQFRWATRRSGRDILALQRARGGGQGASGGGGRGEGGSRSVARICSVSYVTSPARSG